MSALLYQKTTKSEPFACPAGGHWTPTVTKCLMSHQHTYYVTSSYILNRDQMSSLSTLRGCRTNTPAALQRSQERNSYDGYIWGLHITVTFEGYRQRCNAHKREIHITVTYERYIQGLLYGSQQCVSLSRNNNASLSHATTMRLSLSRARARERETHCCNRSSQRTHSVARERDALL